MNAERLQKVLARAGIASRRRCEQLIAEGRVTVDRRVVTEMGLKVDPDKQDIRFDGSRIGAEKKVYYILNKPRGVVCTSADGERHRRAIDLVPAAQQRLFTVGRLDKESEGMVILTNDGEFANRIAHPRYEVPKSYTVEVRGDFTTGQARHLRSGVTLDGKLAKVSSVKLVNRAPERSRLRVTLNEGRRREIRRILKALGYPVLRLKRTRIGRLNLSDLPSGGHRELTQPEVKDLLGASRRRRNTPGRNHHRSIRKGRR